MADKPTYEELEQRIRELERIESEGNLAKEQLSQSHDLMQYIISHARSAIAVHDTDLNYVYVSDRYLKDYRVSEKDVIGKHHYDVFPDLPQKWRDVHQRALAGEVSGADEDPYFREDGSVDWSCWECRPWYKPDGSVGGIIVYTEVISERMRDKEALRQAEENARERSRFVESILDLSPAIIYIYDLVKHRNIYSNEGISKILGYSPEEVLEMGDRLLSELMHHDDFKAYLEKVFPRYGQAQDGERIEHQFRMRHKSGGWNWLDCTEVVYQRGEAGAPSQILGVVYDVTDRKLDEAKIRENEQYIRNILNTVDEGFIVVDRDYRILTANKAYCDLVSLSSEEVLGRHCYEVAHQSDRPCHEAGEECAVRKVFLSGKHHVGVHKHDSGDGEVIYVETKAFPNKDESGNVVSAIETLNNITERYLLEEERLKTQKLESIGTLAGGIAHDFNNLLQGVFGYCSMARMSIDQKEETLIMLGEAEKALHQAVNLTNQLLTFSKGGKPVMKATPVLPVVENAVRFALSGSSSKHEIRVPEDLWYVNVDGGQIEQVIQNILLNADQSMPKGGTVTVSLENIPRGGELPQGLREDDFVKVSIRDTGTGISEKYRGQIFDPYFTTKEKGSGLGLATCYSIVRNHGGTIDVQSKMDAGSTFTLYLPAIREGVAVQSAPVMPEISGHARILVMDDEEMVRKVSGKLIKVLGHECEFAENGEEALEKYRAALERGEPFDLVFLDLTIRGGMGDSDTIRELRVIDPEVKAVMMSGYSDSAALSEYREQGFRMFLKKPYSLEDLRGAINSLLT